MEKTKNIKVKSSKGITLIALVITIIVLLILAGVTIAALSGPNGILTNATKAKEQTEIADEQEKVKLSAVGALAYDNGGEIKRNYLNDELTSYIGTEGIDYSLSESETAPFVVKYIDSGRSYLIDENGNVSEYVNIAEYVKVGNYVDYNPTILNKEGTQVEESKLTYVSPIGSGTEHGNGYDNQTFTVDSNIRWRVLSIEEDMSVNLISESVVKTNTGSEFKIQGAIGYIYAERELHEICKIYGYGYGADTSQITQYNYGGPLDGVLVGKIMGSGARSLIREDIDKKVDAATLESLKQNINYGNTDNPTIEVYYPTVSTANGVSTIAQVKNCEDNTFGYSKNTMINNSTLLDLFFNQEYYWIANRYTKTTSSEIDYEIGKVDNYSVEYGRTCSGENTRLYTALMGSYSVRPVIILKSNIIDINTDYEKEGHWNLK